MAKRKRRKGAAPKPNRQVHTDQLERLANDFLNHYRARRLDTAVPLAREITERFPRASFGWKALGTALMESGEPQEAVAPLEYALELQPDNNEALTNLGKALQQLGRYEEAEARLNQALAGEPGNYQANMHLAGIHQQRGRHDQALGYYERSLESLPDAILAQMRKATALVERRDYEQALAILEPLAEQHPRAAGVLTNLANLYGTMGRFDEAESGYRQAIELQPDAWKAFSNYYFTAHYNPRHRADDLFAIGREWQQRYAPAMRPERPITEPSSTRPLRIGLVSAGLKTHPVGQMILGALEHLPKGHFHLYAYSDSLVDDATARRLKPLMEQWREVPHTSHADLARMIRDDAIDILIDMTGHTSGSRLPVIAEEPAPLIVKWVGGLFNTTGVEAVDYLFSDAVETPEGSDDYYLEKLIRLPDDYICYTPPRHLTAEPGPLPALENGFITLGCFNNPAKINEVLLGQWASLMHQLPDSRLLLKGGQYTDADYCERLHAFMEGQGVTRERVLLEGPAPHAELVATYRRVDIALDPWPYSGGLTTCEALYMGVPVVTLPGPSFAGRHSASHLVNAGLPELVTGTWEEYRQRVVELACDLESLSRIRQHLREVLLQSPVCNGPRFARHFTDAMRAIWQRHCEGKEPAALTFEADGQARFEGEDAPVEIHYAEAPEDDSTFQWQFEGKLIAVDNGGQLLESDVVRQLLQKEALELIAFDPSSQALDTSLKQHKGVHYYPNATLGDGQPGQLHACLDPRLSASLLPLEDEYQPEDIRKGRQVLTRLPLSTIVLDRIDGLPSIDWLVLDDLNDATAILEHGSQALKDTLLLQMKVAFQPTHERQPNLAELQHWASRNGFRFYRLHEPQHRSYLPDEVSEAQRQATELASADILFLPSHVRMAELSENQSTRLAFLLHTVYGIKDMAHALLAEVSEEKAEKYLEAERLVPATGSRGDVESLLEPSGRESKTNTVTHDTDDCFSKGAGSISPGLSAESPAQDAAPEVNSGDASGLYGDKQSHEGEKIESLWELEDAIHVVDVGANPIDGTPPYAGLLQKGVVELVGFEPQKEALRKLQERKGPNETYLPHAVGNGERVNLYLCQAPGMTSTLKPNNQVLDHFQGYPVWGKVKAVEEVDTIRLDDVDEIKKIDWLKIDIQGGELNVFENAEEKLKDALVIQTEVNFIQLYEDQPLFAEIDQWMRKHGFMLHTLIEERKRAYAPMKVNGGIHQGLNQLTTADAVYVKDVDKLAGLDENDIKKMAFILHEAYGSYDLGLHLIRRLVSSKCQGEYMRRVGKSLPVSVFSPGEDRVPVRHLFVVGCGHTGTTLMATILGENKSVYTIKRETSWFLKSGEFSQSLLLEESAAREAGSEWLCEKTPRHVYCYKEISDRFPDAKFIVMTRGAKDVVASMKNRTGDFDYSLNRWLKDNKQAVRVSGGARSLLVRYEDLVENAEKVIREVCDFVGVEYSVSMLDYHRSENAWFGVQPRETNGKGERSHLERRAWQMSQPIQDRRGVWRDKLTDEEVKRVDDSSREIMRDLGYDV